MKFIYPEFLYALAALAIPIIIHLFNFRRYKKIYFPNVQLLKAVKQETQSKSRLKHLLILLSRLLAIAFLVFAFAQPFIPSGQSDTANQKNVVGIYIDNSFSMESTGESGILLDEAKNKAIEIVKSYKITDKFALLNNQFNAGDQRLLNNEEIIEKIEEITITPQTRTISSAYSRSRDILNTSEITNKSLYILSDFQKSISDFKNIIGDSLINTFFTPIAATEVNNLYIDSCWFESPTHLLFQQEELHILIKNSSENDLENIPLKLYINEKSVAPASFSIKANSETILTLTYLNKTDGIQNGKMELRDYPVVSDDIFYFSYTISKNIDILEINSEKENDYLRSVYSTDSIFNFSDHLVSQLDYSLIKKSNLVVLNNLDEVSSGLSNAIKNFTDNNGSLLIFPSNNIDYTNYREFLSLLQLNYYTTVDTVDTKVREINLNHPLYKNVFEGKPDKNPNLPLVYNHYDISNNPTSFKNNVLTLKNGEPFLTEYKVGKGTIYLSTVSLSNEFSNLSNHALLVPTLYNIALLSQKNYPLFHIIGNNTSIDLNHVEKNNTFHIKNNHFDIIPKVRTNNSSTSIFVNSGITEAGNYSLENNNTKIGLAYNYNRSESDLTCLSIQDIEDYISKESMNAQLVNTENNTITSALSDLSTGKRYWKWCIILTLVFLAFEIALIKLFK